MADEKKSESGGIDVNISVGKEIDRSLAEIVTALLRPVTTEVGNLMADAVGFLSDRVRQKRELNAQIGLSEVRKKLEASNTEMKDITPPKEEELHLLVTGLSLSDDETLRDLWAGIFAEALKPESKVIAERPYLNVLASLSPMDAKIIEFLAFTVRSDAELKQNAFRYMPKDFASITPEEKLAMKNAADANSTLRRDCIKSIEERAKAYGIEDLSDGSWAHNLLRLGIIERVPLRSHSASSLSLHSLDERAMLSIVEHMNEKFHVMSAEAVRNSNPPKKLIGKDKFSPQLQIEVRLTEFGSRLAHACGLL